MATNQLTTKPKPLKSLKAGFTLIELLIVTGLSTMLLLTITAMFMTFLTSSASTNISRTLNREGDFALNQLEFMTRNALSVDCIEDDNQLNITSADQQLTTLSVEETGGINRLSSTSADTTYLTSDAVEVTQSDFFDCSAAGDKTYVDISLVLQKIDEDGDHVGQPETYTTSIQLRN